MSHTKERIKKLLPGRMNKLLLAKGGNCHLTFAQEGEDRVLAALLGYPGRTSPGFYIDVGAHHPEKFSNTYLFYTKGWSGINIDAMPGSMGKFDRQRSRDINIEAAIAAEDKILIYYEFNEPALNGFSKEIAEQRDHYQEWKITGERKIKTTRLDSLLAQHLPPGQAIDFLSVDVEGLDLEVLQSNDWTKFRPAVLLVEDSESQVLEQGKTTGIMRFMQEIGFQLCCKTPLTSFFVDQRQIAITPLGLRLKLPHVAEFANVKW